MTGNWTTVLEATALAAYLRGSVWAYPLVNAGHIFGVALLVGAIIALDLRLIGFWPSIQPAPLWRVLTRVAAFGLGMAVLCGGLLFITRATAYIQSAWFVAKMAIVALGIANALALHLLKSDDMWLTRSTDSKIPLRVRIAALNSLVLWSAALFMGRFVGYF